MCWKTANSFWKLEEGNKAMSWNKLSFIKGRMWPATRFYVHQIRTHSGSSVESRIELATLRSQIRDSATRPSQSALVLELILKKVNVFRCNVIKWSRVISSLFDNFFNILNKERFVGYNGEYAIKVKNIKSIYSNIDVSIFKSLLVNC